MILSALMLVPALETLFADPPASPSCSVVLTVDVRESDDEPSERQVYAYDRTTNAWSFLSKDGEAPTPEERAAIESGDETEDRTLPADFYAKALTRGGLDWQAVEGEPGRFTADDLPDGEIEMNGRDVSDKIALAYDVGDGPEGPVLRRGAARLKKTWRIPFVAKIDEFSITRDYAPASAQTGAQGAMLPVREVITFAGDIIGKTRRSRVETAYDDWDCVPASGGAAGAVQ